MSTAPRIARVARVVRVATRRLRRFLVRCFTVDTRSLATFRVFLGLLVIADLGLRSRNFSFYYTDTGIVPQELAERGTADGAISIYYLTSETELIAALMVVQALVALAMVVGYRTRAATVVSFLFVVSLDHHNPFVLSYADTLFRLLFFWAMFLPLGERWSVDALHRGGAPRDTVAGLATAFALSQMVFMYLLNGIHKSMSPLWRSGDAAPLVFGIDEMTFLIGDLLRAVPTLISYGGLLWFYMLLASLLLVLFTGRARVAMVALFFVGHASFALTVRIGAFAYVAMAGLTLFLQPAFWRDAGRIARLIGVDPTRVHGTVRDRVGEPLAAALPAFRVVPDRVARVRSIAYTLAIGAVVVALALVVAVFLLNVGAVIDGNYDQNALNDEVAAHPAGEHVVTVAEAVGIDQPEWSVFAPSPRTTDRYYVFGARTVEGDRLDVYNDRPFTWDRPGDELQRQHDTYRQRFFMNSVRRGAVGGELTRNYGEHLCATYAAEHGIELTHISMFEVTETITFETVDDPAGRESERDHFHRHVCGG
ncbi:HTTM domain-containing protein [Halorubrum sp. JWXQ-INN 858]|uniref:HTTM domain-containing protein n=1 Tax=Halorubrum sp. JWXQ-INN 858 TaxID=2690782 RepID=UPI00135AF28E|nr:HTTM domain-containing protein [Halorubrum sp. JWXQ-INN 858]MWV65046.1 HTTM domain-containing protein [Halorubrum sp. JWXQ-INN 858]